VLYIGIIITAQAFQATPREHAPAVAVSLFPALAATLVITLGLYLSAANAPATLEDLVRKPTPATIFLPGLLTLTGANSAWIVVTLILTAISAALIDRQYKAAAIWCAAGTVLTGLGIVHAYRLDGNVIHEHFIWQWAWFAGAAANATATTYAYEALPIAVGYGLATVLLACVAIRERRRGNA